MQLTVRFDQVVGELHHFWRSTGFTPAKRLLGPDMQQALAYVGSLPFGGITYVRVHSLLDLVSGTGFETETPAYDWAELDRALSVLTRNGLRPIFELMGNPSGWWSDFSDDGQLHAWRRLVRDLALHLIERHGHDRVWTWPFESWNEPDCQGSWPAWAKDPESFCRYYDACSEGLSEAEPSLRLGGPATCRTLSPMLKTFLAHCDSGRSCFTGAEGVRLDFISFHEKGVRAHAEDLNPDTAGICERERQLVEYLRAEHPRLAELPLSNDECDPQVGWDSIHTWHAHPYYAAIVAKIIHQHLDRVAGDMGVNYGVLSNDNGFLGTWGQRGLLARFGSEKGFELVKKPVLNVMALLALLGATRCAVEASEPSEQVGALATVGGMDQVAVLVYNSRDRIMASGGERIELRLEGLPFETAMLAHYRIDETHGHPYAVWEAAGAPDAPSAELVAAMRACQEPALFDEPREVTAKEGRLRLAFGLPLPSVSLLLLSQKPADGPATVRGLHARAEHGLTGEHVMLTWKGLGSRCLRTYEVFCGESPEGPFNRVSGPDLVCSAFLHAGAGGGAAYYRVRAVDYWGRAGELSEVAALKPAK